jgi:hypothetical protein
MAITARVTLHAYHDNKLNIMKFTLSLIVILIFLSCSKKPQCEEMNEYPIVPGVGVGPYKIGMSEKSLTDLICKPFNKLEKNAWFSDDVTTYYFIKNMTFVLKNHRVKEVVVWGSYSGMYDELNVDYTYEELESYGEVITHNGEYRILEIPGISFGIEDSEEGKGISVF